MATIWRGACALTLAAAVVGGASAQTAGNLATGQLAYATDSIPATEQVDLASCETCDSYGGEVYDDGCYGGCDVYGDCGCDDGAMLCGPEMGDGVCRRSRIFVGGEYLSVRAHFSEATAFRRASLVDASETFEQFDFDYGDSYRVFAGIRLCECDAEIRFAYTNFSSDGGFGPVEDAGETGGSTTFTTIASPFEVVPAGVGDSLSGTASVEIDNYDLGFARSIPLGSPLCGCDCGTSCDPCDPCGCGAWCPAWDIQWSGGIRVANVESQLNYASNILPANGGSSANRTATSNVSFDGVGLRTGLLGRRYLGKSGLASVFVKGDISLLLGDVEVEAEGTVFNRTSLTSTEVIPVTEIEAGGTLYLTRNLQFTGGYLLSAWHDLGHRFEYDYSVVGTNNLVSTTGTISADDANMLMFDGWFLRLEAFF